MADLETWDRLERVELTEADASVDEIDDLLDVDADGVIDPAADRAELHQFVGRTMIDGWLTSTPADC
jgi:hypothetical protein